MEGQKKFCMYILENAEDGKYGVYISELDNTIPQTQSLNRNLVDLGYAEVSWVVSRVPTILI